MENLRIVDTASIRILDVILYEDELGISNNEYSEEKMRFLVDDLGYETCYEIIDSFHRKLLKLAYEYNFKTIPQTEIRANISLDSAWNYKVFVRAMKKVQKALEIAYISKHMDDLTEYNKLFKFELTDDSLRKQLNYVASNAKQLNSSNTVYNNELASLKEDFKEHNNLSYDEVVSLVKKSFTKYTHADITDKLNTILLSIDNHELEVSERCRKKGIPYEKDITYIHTLIKRNITHINNRVIVDVEKEQEILKQRKIKLISILNDIYGYDRYIVKELNAVK